LDEGGAGLQVRLHDRSGLGDADIDEMRDLGLDGGFDCGKSGSTVHAAELCGLGRAGMGDAHELDEGIGGRDLGGEGGGAECVAQDGGAAWRQLAL